MEGGHREWLQRVADGGHGRWSEKVMEGCTEGHGGWSQRIMEGGGGKLGLYINPLTALCIYMLFLKFPLLLTGGRVRK